MTQDTDLGGPGVVFPPTRCSVVLATASTDTDCRKRAFQTLVAAYWKPVYKYIRVRWSAANEEAKDLTQGFFASAFEKDFFAAYDPSRARFRTYLRVCLDGFVAKERAAAGRLKRGGGVTVMSLDFDAAEAELSRRLTEPDLNAEDFFRREWLRTLFTLAVDDLRRQCAGAGKTDHFAIFERYDLQGPDAPRPPTYADLAREFGLPVTQVTNHLAFARRRFRQFVLDRLREMTGDDEEYQAEARRLFGGRFP